MGTLYELFHVKENATQDEITQAYQHLLKKADSLPQTEQLIEQVRKMKIAYEILSNSEKREKYDSDLAMKRTNKLLENIQVKQEENEFDETKNQDFTQGEKIKQTISNQIEIMTEIYNAQIKQEKNKQKIEEKKQIRKAKREAKKRQQIKREMEIQAYGRYLEKQGYKVKYPWTWIRVKRLFITIFILLFTIIILWQIPFVQNICLNLYKENFVIKFLVDAIRWIIDMIKWW